MRYKGQLIKCLKDIKQSKVTHCRAGGGAGSVILIEFDNNKYSFFLYCAWRIENNEKVIATSAGNTKPITGIVAKGAKMLEEKIVSSIEISSFFDLCVKFEDGFCLRTFGDITYHNILLASKNWSFSIPTEDLSFDITKGFKIKKGKYYS